MGFHIYIYCQLDICEKTGKHFYYKSYEKIFDMPPIVPEAHRKFIIMKSDIFRIYTSLVTDETSTTVSNFRTNYPSWSDILNDSDFKEEYFDYWAADMHVQFYLALKWFSEQGICYMISWSN